MKKFLEIIKNKWLIKGTTTLLLVLIVIACYIGLNMLVEKVNVENLDFTEKKLYSLSDETKTKLSDLNQDVTIHLINATNYRYLIDYAKKYTILNNRIKVEEISDLSSRVDLKTKYNLSDTDMLIVIKEGEKEKTLTSNDLSTYDYSTNKQIDLTEEAITNAIVELSMDKKPAHAISFTHMATASIPMVSCLSITMATLTLVPHPSVPETRVGSSISLNFSMENAPENPPIPPSTSGLIVLAMCFFISSTDLYPASISTPEVL